MKKQIRKISVFCMALTLAIVFAACGQKSKVITLKVGDNWSSSHPMAAALDNVFKKIVEEKSKGEIKVEVYHDGSLGNEADLWNGVRNGSIEVAVVGTPMNQEYAPMLISDWPFLYRSLSHAKAVWTGPIADEMSASFHEKFPTVYLLSWGPNSARTFTSNKPLTKVADFVGQKFRMPNNPIHIGIVQNLGASAQSIPLGDLFSALQTNVVDGQDNGMVTVISQHFDEVQKYLYETNHIIATLEILISAPVMDKLTPEQQGIIRDAAKQAAIKAWDDYIASIDADRQTLVTKGVTVTQCSPADQAQIIKKIAPLTNKLLADNAWAKDLINKIKAVN
jgi:tripartite ATP-independent transporter DctP family solute receptor